MDEILNSDDIVSIEISGAPASIAKEFHEWPQIRHSDHTVPSEIRVLYSLDEHDVAIVIDGFTALVIDRGDPGTVSSHGGDAHFVTNFSRRTVIDIVEAKLVLDAGNRRRLPSPGWAFDQDLLTAEPIDCVSVGFPKDRKKTDRRDCGDRDKP